MFDPSKSQGFQAQSANIQQAVSPEQAAQANAQAQSGIGQQQNFVNALQAQNGIGNQSNVFNQQQQLANQLQLQAQGGGPNPAQAALNQATGQNIQNQAALMASQRGTSSNPGLMSRQAAMQGANIQQQAVGQGATMQAQQQIAAQHALQAQQGMMGNLAGQQVGQQAGAISGLNQAIQGNQSNMLGAINAQNQANIQNASQQNQANAGIAQQNAKQSGDLFGGLIQGAGSAGAALLSDERLKKNVKPAEKESYQFLDSLKPHSYEYKDPNLEGAGPGKHVSVMAQELEKTPLGKQMVKEGPSGKMVDYAQGMAQMLAAQADLHERLKAIEHGKPYADGGAVEPAPMAPATAMAPPSMNQPNSMGLPTVDWNSQPSRAGSAAGKFLSGMGGGMGGDKSESFKGGASAGNAVGMGIGKGIGALANALKPAKKTEFNDTPISSTPDVMMAAHGGRVPAVLSPGEKYLTPKQAKEVAKGEKSTEQVGKKVPGKAKVKGDSLENDTVPAKLQAGGVVIPRSVMNSKDPAGNAAKFVAAILAKKGISK